MTRRNILCLILVICLGGLFMDSLSPATEKFKERKIELAPLGESDKFFVEPNRSSEFEFKVKTLAEKSEIKCQIQDYSGNPVGQKKVCIIENGKIKITGTFSPGYYEICFPDLDLKFGICALSAYKGIKDPFYAIEGLIGSRSNAYQNSITDVLVRYGIYANREWCHFQSIEPERGHYREATDQFYHLSGAKGMRSIFCINDFPDRFEPMSVDSRGKVFPTDLEGLPDDLRNIIQRRQNGIDAFHLFNEYDPKKIPSSVWMPGIKAAGWAVRDLPLNFVSAPFALGEPSEFPLKDNIDNHLLDFIDVFAFHSYRAPETMIDHIAAFREFMKNHPKAGLPLWITECGKPWHRGLPPELVKQVYGGPMGKLHPNQNEDALSALWITMKGIEAKAGGVQRYFPFTLPFFQENNNNFGMMDYHNTPLRSMTAYCHSIHELGGKSYIGDIKMAQKEAVRFRLFADSKKRTAVLYTGTLEKRMVDLGDLPILTGRTIDGKDLMPLKKNVYQIENGLAYFDLDSDFKVDSFLDRETKAMKLLRQAESYQPVKRVCSPVVYSYKIDKNTSFNNSQFYWESDIFTTRVYNFSEEKQIIAPRLLLPEEAKILKSPDQKQLTLLPGGKADLQWTVDLSAIKNGSFRVGIADSFFPFAGFTLPFLDKRKIITRTFDFTNPKRWKNNTSGKSTFEYDEKEKALKVTTEFKPGSDPFKHWVFPEFVLDQKKEKLDSALGISFEMKIVQDEGKTTGQRSPCVMLVPEDRKKHYIGLSFKEPSPQWSSYSAAFPQNDPLQYRAIRFGTCPAGYKVVFWLRNIQIQFTK